MLCKSPIYIKNAEGLVPCGQCLSCRINKVRRWTFRLLLEYLSHKNSIWVTLTYNDQFVPNIYIDKEGQIFEGNQGQKTLHPDHMRLFIMRLRKQLGTQKIRYFYCGEYGDQTKRPHYHLCIFGMDIKQKNLLTMCWTDPKSKISMGHISVDYLTPQNIRYTCGYALKKLTKKGDEKLDGVYPEFIRHSLGIGKYSIEKIAKSLTCKSAELYYLTYDDIPRTFNVMDKEYPIDRYTRHKLLQMLNKEQDALNKGKLRFKKEMFDLHTRAQNSKEFSKSSASKAFSLEYQYKVENAQSILNQQTRAKMYLDAKEKQI